MRDLWFLVPALIGIGFLYFTFKREVPRGAEMNPKRLGVAFIVAALLMWWSTAILLVEQEKFYVMFNLMLPVLFFMGVGCQFPGQGDIVEFRSTNVGLKVCTWIGLVLGLAHAGGMLFSEQWQSFLFRFYSGLGIG